MRYAHGGINPSKLSIHISDLCAYSTNKHDDNNNTVWHICNACTCVMELCPSSAIFTKFINDIEMGNWHTKWLLYGAYGKR